MNLKSVLIILLLLTISYFTLSEKSFASTIDELETKINERSQNITDLEKEIAQYETELKATATQSKSLQGAISTLNLTKKKLETDIKVTQNKILLTIDELEELSFQIDDKQKSIDLYRDSLRESLKQINEADSKNLIETILENSSISEALNDSENIKTLEGAVREKTLILKNLKTDLVNKETLTTQKKKSLENLNGTLGDQKKVVEENVKETKYLLSVTKNKEQNYQKTLAEKKALKEAFQRELDSFESELKFQIDPSSIPHTGSGVLSWPLSGKIKVTQKFGKTDFSDAHPGLYSGQGHNGVDFAASPGTPILSAGNGVVLGTGNTDTVCPGASYGKWVFVEHPNGLSTLYAHLSFIKVSVGQSISTGDVVGYSGSTGYATGPHLHFTVYASQGVKIMSRQSKVCGGTYVIPIANLQAYLDPLSYL